MRHVSRPRLDKSWWVRVTFKLGLWCLVGGTVIASAGLIALGSYFDEGQVSQAAGATTLPPQSLGMIVGLMTGPNVLLLGAGLCIAGLLGRMMLAARRFGLRGLFALTTVCGVGCYFGSGAVMSLVAYVAESVDWSAAGGLEFEIPNGQAAVSVATLVMVLAELVLPSVVLAGLVVVGRDAQTETRDGAMGDGERLGTAISAGPSWTVAPTTAPEDAPKNARESEAGTASWLGIGRSAALFAGVTFWAELMLVAAFLALVPYMPEVAGPVMLVGVCGYGSLMMIALGVALAAFVLGMVQRHERRAMQFSVRAMMTATTLCAVLLGTWFSAIQPRLNTAPFFDDDGVLLLGTARVEDGRAEAVAFAVAMPLEHFAPHTLWLTAIGALGVLTIQLKRILVSKLSKARSERAAYTGETISSSSIAGSPSQWMTAVRP